MDHPVIDLTHACVVKLTSPQAVGTGFFVVPGLIVTCAHVVGNRKTNDFYGDPKGTIKVRWQDNDDFSTATVLPDKWKPDEDVALLQCHPMPEPHPPCVLLGRACLTYDRLSTFGYPKEAQHAEPATFECKGYSDDKPPMLKIKMDNIRGGMSGSPVLNMETKRVCGMINFTDDKNSMLGGGGVTAATLLSVFDDLEALQEEYHQKHPTWYTKIGVSIPGDLKDQVEAKIAETLDGPGLTELVNGFQKEFLEKEGVDAKRPAAISAALVKLKTTDALMLVSLAKESAIKALEKNNAGEGALSYVRRGVEDILGWLVLLAVNSAWLETNRERLHLEEYPGAIELPVKRDTGIEIIHAALNRRQARFNLQNATLFGSHRMPAPDDHFLEGGIAAVNKVNEIKRSIFGYMNLYWGEKDIPDHFTRDDDEALNAQLKWFHGHRQGKYLVIRRSDTSCPIDRDVYTALLNDLPDLQVIFHNTDEPGDAFNVSEITFYMYLENFFR
ncbi:S1 family peptidase [Desulfosarcina ovata]|uniref:Serine protease n=1 Tax=Desulfosarcina ovata subsp. ovata TaxID=2752305 RepID=A0A5K8AJ66_9BACT|nr:serine protease [Desulfosarcina ovata]BBO92732.1 hypothetical protein DSCOOX_59120 [Desulfosarcina ovata subsp. ovata]